MNNKLILIDQHAQILFVANTPADAISGLLIDRRYIDKFKIKIQG